MSKIAVNVSAKVARSKKHKKQAKKLLSRTSAGRQVNSTKGNNYLKSLLYPELAIGAKIPDFEMFPSGTFQNQFQYVLASNAAGDQAMAIAPWYLNTYTSQASATTTWTWTSTVYSTTGYAAIQAAYQALRIVSACVVGEFIGTTSNDQGEVCVALIPTGDNWPTTFAGLALMPNAETYPIRNGFRIIYAPQDPNSLNYVTSTVDALTSSQAYANIPTPIFLVGVNGVQASTNVLRLRWYFNFEGQPASEAIDLVNPTPSPSNPLQMAEAANVMSRTSLSDVFTSNAGVGAYAAAETGQTRPGHRPNRGVYGYDTAVSTAINSGMSYLGRRAAEALF